MIRLCDDHLFDADTSDVARLARWLGIQVPSRREGESFGAWNMRVVRAVQRAERKLEGAYDFVQERKVRRGARP